MARYAFLWLIAIAFTHVLGQPNNTWPLGLAHDGANCCGLAPPAATLAATAFEAAQHVISAMDALRNAPAQISAMVVNSMLAYHDAYNQLYALGFNVIDALDVFLRSIRTAANPVPGNVVEQLRSFYNEIYAWLRRVDVAFAGLAGDITDYVPRNMPSAVVTAFNEFGNAGDEHNESTRVNEENAFRDMFSLLPADPNAPRPANPPGDVPAHVVEVPVDHHAAAPVFDEIAPLERRVNIPAVNTLHEGELAATTTAGPQPQAQDIIATGAYDLGSSTTVPVNVNAREVDETVDYSEVPSSVVTTATIAAAAVPEAAATNPTVQETSTHIANTTDTTNNDPNKNNDAAPSGNNYSTTNITRSEDRFHRSSPVPATDGNRADRLHSLPLPLTPLPRPDAAATTVDYAPTTETAADPLVSADPVTTEANTTPAARIAPTDLDASRTTLTSATPPRRSPTPRRSAPTSPHVTSRRLQRPGFVRMPGAPANHAALPAVAVPVNPSAAPAPTSALGTVPPPLSPSRRGANRLTTAAAAFDPALPMTEADPAPSREPLPTPTPSSACPSAQTTHLDRTPLSNILNLNKS